MKNFNWEMFERGGVAVLFESMDDWWEFAELADRRCLRWVSGESITSGTPMSHDFRAIGPRFLVGVACGCDGLRFSSEEWYASNGYKIIHWKSPSRFTKGQLKNGDICELRNGERYIFFAEENMLLGYGFRDSLYVEMKEYLDTLTDKDGTEALDVVRIERDDLCVFERKYAPRKVTMQEVNEKFGEEVCIVED